MDTFIQLTVTGLANGAVLALAALGFVLIFKATGVINFAQGAFLLLGAYGLYWLITDVGLHWALALGVMLATAMLFGVGVERSILRPMVGQPIISVIMLTIGLNEVLRAVQQYTWGPQPRRFPDFIPSGSVSILGATVPADRLWAIGIVAVVFGLFTLFFQRSREGIAMRAVADDQQAALTMGISVRRTFALSWGLAAVSAVIGGALVANIIGVSGGLVEYGLLVFAVVILGGLDSIPGALAGGAIVGLLISYTGGYLGGGLQQVVPYIALVLILLVKPYGLFGQTRIERV
jgi:branched-chain amino acid transport system permease protein